MNYAVIVAAGSGSRMQSDIPKQFLPIGSKPILYYTIQKFLAFSVDLQVIVVLPSEFINHPALVASLESNERIHLTTGGASRFESVRKGLSLIQQSEGIVFIHDGVRPFVSQEVLQRCFDKALESGSAIPVLDLKDSIRIFKNGESVSVERADYKAVQTPQTFQCASIIHAYQQNFESRFTDEASVYEAAGMHVQLVAGNEENIKITTPLDFKLAELLLAAGF